MSGADERVDVAPGGRRRSEPNVDHFPLDVQNVGADIVCEHLDGRPRESDPHLARDVDLLDIVGPIAHAASLSAAGDPAEARRQRRPSNCCADLAQLDSGRLPCRSATPRSTGCGNRRTAIRWLGFSTVR